MKVPPPRQPTVWNALTAGPAMLQEASEQPREAAITLGMEHLDYNHRSLKIGPLDHLVPLTDTGRFAIR